MTDMIKNAANVLHRAADLIEEPRHWCTHYEALDKDDEPTLAVSPDATRWCAIGAIKRAAGDDLEALLLAKEAIYAMLRDELDTEESLTRWNDNPYRLHGEVIALLQSVADALDDVVNGRPPRPARII